MANKKSNVKVKFTKKATTKEEVLKALEKARVDIGEAALLAGNYAVEVVVKKAPEIKEKAKKIAKQVEKSVKLNAPIVKEKAKKIAKKTIKKVKKSIK